MNKDVTVLYVINKDNITVAFGNLQDCIKTLSNIEKEARNYMYYYRAMQKSDKFEWQGYLLQRLI